MAETQVTDTASQSSGGETEAMMWMGIAVIVLSMVALSILVFFPASRSGSELVALTVLLVGMIGAMFVSSRAKKLFPKSMTGVCFGGAVLLLASTCIVTPAGILGNRLYVEAQDKTMLLEGREVYIGFPWAQKVGDIPETISVERGETEVVGDATIIQATKVSKSLPKDRDELYQKIISAGGLEEYLEAEREKLRAHL